MNLGKRSSFNMEIYTRDDDDDAVASSLTLVDYEDSKSVSNFSLGSRRSVHKLSDDTLASSSRKSARDSKNFQALTINKLKFDQIGMVGREKETKILKNCLERMIMGNQNDADSADSQKHRSNGKELERISEVSYSSAEIYHRQSNNFSYSSRSLRTDDDTFQQNNHRPASFVASSSNKNLRNTNTKLNKKNELIFLGGYSGTGKSMLANSMKEEVAGSEGLFVRGKFEPTNNDEPYQAIAEAFGKVCIEVDKKLKSDNVEESTKFFGVGKRIMSELGSGVQLLIQVIPELEDMLPVARRNSANSVNAPDSDDFQAQKERVKYAFRVLTRVLSSYFTPLVVVLDDLQWADIMSLEVIDMIMSDCQNTDSAVMIIGCYRSNEIENDDTHLLRVKMKELKEKNETAAANSNFILTELQIGCFDVDSVNRVIMAMLSIDNETVSLELAEICHKRTLGNPFFLIQFVTMLEEQELVSFNIGLMKWCWHIPTIENHTMSTSNVVDLLQSRMKKIPEQCQLLLQYAACLEYAFDVSALDILWQKHAVSKIGMSAVGEEKLSSLLAELVEGNYIERVSYGVYHWVHDKVQEVAMTLGDASTNSFQYEIGSILYDCLGRKKLEDMLFVVVDLINKGATQAQMDYIELNLRAAENARSMSAFHSASVYITKGIDLLPIDKWTAHRSLALRLYTLGGEIEAALGREEVMEKYCNEVLTRADLTTIEKLPVYISKCQKLCNIDMKYDETCDLCFEVLKILEGPVSTTKGVTLTVKALSSLMKTIKKVKSIPRDTFQEPKVMTDRTQKSIMLFLSRILYASYRAGNKILFVWSVCQMVQLTLKHGVNVFSGQSYVALAGLTAAVKGDIETASEIAETALLIQQKIKSEYTKSITLFMVNFTLAWTKPLQDCLQRLERGYACGMRSGNVEYAMWNAYLHVTSSYIRGQALPSIESSLSQTVSQMDDLRQLTQALYCRMWHQMALNLSGRSSETVLLVGETFDCEHFVPKSSLIGLQLEVVKLELFVFFGEFECAAELAIKRGDALAKAAPGSPLIPLEAFRRGVALYAMARRTRRGKYIKHATKVRKTIEGWIKKGNPNVPHYHLFLSAEQAAYDKKNDDAEAKYKEAIKHAARSGHMHDAALFNERYSDFCIQALSDQEEAKYRISEAIRYYKDWGAEAKVQILRDS